MNQLKIVGQNYEQHIVGHYLPARQYKVSKSKGFTAASGLTSTNSNNWAAI